MKSAKKILVLALAAVTLGVLVGLGVIKLW